MIANFIDIIRCKFKSSTKGIHKAIRFVESDFGKIRVLDTGGHNPVILNVPDGPNVIEHHLALIEKLSDHYRVVCFEFPGIGFSYPNAKYDYSFSKASKLIINLLNILKIEKTALAFSCSNGFYAINVATLFPTRITYLFLSQTPSLLAMQNWTEKAIPKVLKIPIIGQIANAFLEKKFAKIWYSYALPKITNKEPYQNKAIKALHDGGCFCLSSLVQGLTKEINSTLKVLEVPATIIWGSKDFTHQKTDVMSIKEHLPNCEIIQFKNCGHFPELENTNKFVQIVHERLSNHFNS